MELQLLRQKVDLDNEQLRAAKLAEFRDTMGRKGRLSRVSMLGGGGDTGEGDEQRNDQFLHGYGYWALDT
jgi:hypothetical protein